MCRICAQHGGGMKWYLNPENYRSELLEDKKRKEVIEGISGWAIDYYTDASAVAGNLAKSDPTLRSFVNEQAFNEHAGQVAVLEDALKIAELAEDHVLLPCGCRRLVHGSIDKVCLGIGPSRDLIRSYKPSEKVEPIDSEEAKARLREWDRRGLIHYVLYAKAPYPIGVCSCDLTYCTAFKARFLFGLENGVMKGHEIAIVDQERCDGCSSYGIPRCVHKCQFGALHWNRTENKANVDSMTCFGCGVCRVACDKGAIRLVERERIPVLRNRW